MQFCGQAGLSEQTLGYYTHAMHQTNSQSQKLMKEFEKIITCAEISLLIFRLNMLIFIDISSLKFNLYFFCTWYFDIRYAVLDQNIDQNMPLSFVKKRLIDSEFPCYHEKQAPSTGIFFIFELKTSREKCDQTIFQKWTYRLFQYKFSNMMEFSQKIIKLVKKHKF